MRRASLLVVIPMVIALVASTAQSARAIVHATAWAGAFTGWAVVEPITFPVSTAHSPQVGPFPKGHPVSDTLSTVTKQVEGFLGQPPNSVLPKFDSPKKGVPKIFTFGTGVKYPHPKGLPNECVVVGVWTHSLKGGPKDLVTGPTCSIRASGLVLPKNAGTLVQTGPWCGNSSGVGSGVFEFQPGLAPTKKTAGLTFTWFSKGTILMVVGTVTKGGTSAPFFFPTSAIPALENSCNDNLVTVFQVSAPIWILGFGMLGSGAK